jgi:hypothetical protein
MDYKDLINACDEKTRATVLKKYIEKNLNQVNEKALNEEAICKGNFLADVGFFKLGKKNRQALFYTYCLLPI